MNPQRALIAAAEAMIFYRDVPCNKEFTEGLWERLSAAISSAKAAEEGVETRYRVDVMDRIG